MYSKTDSKQFPVRHRKPSTLGTLFYTNPQTHAEAPVYGGVGLPYPKLQELKKTLVQRGYVKENLIIHRYE